MNRFRKAVAADPIASLPAETRRQGRGKFHTGRETYKAPETALSGKSPHTAYKRWLIVLTLVVGFAAGEAASAASAAAAPPPCTDFQLVTSWGTVKSEVRPYQGDPIGYYTWWWFINDLSHRPGKYDWQMFVNGKPVTATQSADKDDMLHFGQPRYSSGKYLWKSGDVIHVDALHKTQDSKIYITPLNQCTVP
ncbi:hypothetical protein ACWEKR_06845 [Nocardia sp. NPDC004573]